MFPLLLVGFTWFILGNFPYSSTRDEQVILPLVLYPEILWFVGSLISLLCFVMIYRVRLKLLVNFNLVAFGTILLLLMFLMLFVPNERIRLRQSVHHQEQSFHLIDYWIYPTSIRDDLERGFIVLYQCDSSGIVCEQLSRVNWGGNLWWDARYKYYPDMPDAILEQTDDSIRLMINDEVVFELPIEAE